MKDGNIFYPEQLLKTWTEHSSDIEALHISYSNELRSEECKKCDQDELEFRLADSQAFWDAISLIRLGKEEGTEQLKEIVCNQIEKLSSEKARHYKGKK